MSLALALGSISLVGSLLGESDKNKQRRQQARAHGRKRAGIADFQQQNKKVLVSSIQQILENQAFAKIDINRNQSSAEAQARVNAAQAGVGGGSTEAIIADTKLNAKLAENNVERNTKSAINQEQQNFVDTQINSENSLSELDTSSRNQTINHALSFAQGFVGGLE